ncbi:SIMPL domain-containing protein [Microbacterium invictum]|uniref:SIMPL domain-containing protein n=1 Tax=Microbacterium invictum TaxID=515415 RepID=A0ABZ0VGW1_9MICO|nr:SIMPL domain-containing protein [Microbacterium invictum]WQB71866.1 SIMPL domain-containing protein [Microbacterium invictum]
MKEVVVTVHGEHEARVAPEEAVATLVVRAEGATREQVVSEVSAWTAPLRDELDSARAAGRVAQWSSDSVAVWSERPWNADGKRLAPVVHAAVNLAATFTDFGALSTWASEVIERDGVQFSGVEWRLSPLTRAALERSVAAEAVTVAVERATAYARALGLSDVTPIEVADAGMLTEDRGARAESARPLMARAAFSGDAGGADIRLQPTDVVVAATVDARFIAR